MTTFSAFEHLRNAIPPPSEPIYAETNWPVIEKKLGWELPIDYKRFIETYGSGGFFPVEVFVWNLSHSFPPHDQIMSTLDHMEELDSGAPFTEVLGNTPVYIWGQDGVGCKYLWAREGEPENWYVVVTMGRLDFRKFSDLSMSEFLVKLLVERDEEISTLIWGSVKASPIEFRPSEA